jgi:hypothetical protein
LGVFGKTSAVLQYGAPDRQQSPYTDQTTPVLARRKMMLSYLDACHFELVMQQALRDRTVDPARQAERLPGRGLATWLAGAAALSIGFAFLANHIG